MKKHKRKLFAVIALILILSTYLSITVSASDAFTAFDDWNYTDGYDIYEADINMLHSVMPFTITWYDNLSLLNTTLQGFHGYGGLNGSVSVVKDSNTGLYTINSSVLGGPDQRQQTDIFPNRDSLGNKLYSTTTRYGYSSYSMQAVNIVDENLAYNSKVVYSAVLFDVDNHHYYYDSRALDNDTSTTFTYPYGCQMNSTDIYFNTGWLKLAMFEDGLGGISIPYAPGGSNSPLWDQAGYDISFDVVTDVGNTVHYENTDWFGSIINGTRLYLIPSNDFSFFDQFGNNEWLKIVNLKIVYKFGDVSFAPTNQQTPSFTYYSFDTCVAVSDDSMPFNSAQVDPDQYLVQGSYSGISLQRFYNTHVMNERYLAFQSGVDQGGSSTDFTSWIANAVSGFLNVPLFGIFSIGGILAVIIAMGFLFMILRYFAGG